MSEVREKRSDRAVRQPLPSGGRRSWHKGVWEGVATKVRGKPEDVLSKACTGESSAPVQSTREETHTEKRDQKERSRTPWKMARQNPCHRSHYRESGKEETAGIRQEMSAKRTLRTVTPKVRHRVEWVRSEGVGGQCAAAIPTFRGEVISASPVCIEPCEDRPQPKRKCHQGGKGKH